jgi:hypothetical protein
MQSQVDSVYGMFVKSVAQQRGVSQSAVRDGMGQGRSLLANDAVKANLADRTGTLDEVLAKYGVKKSAGRSGSRAEAEVVPPTAIDVTVPVVAAKPPVDNPDNQPDNDNNDDQDDRDQACHACKACSASKFCGCNADDDVACACSCSACEGCDNAGTKSNLTTPKLTAEQEKAKEADLAGVYLVNLQRRRRQMQLL